MIFRIAIFLKLPWIVRSYPFVHAKYEIWSRAGTVSACPGTKVSFKLNFNQRINVEVGQISPAYETTPRRETIGVMESILGLEQR
jgi:hypothetical protein